MRKLWVLGIFGAIALSVAGCGGDNHPPPPPPIVTGPGLVGIDDTSDATAPLLTVTYSVPGTPGTTTVQILSDFVSDGDIAFDPVLSSYFPLNSPSTVLFGIDSLDAHLPEYRAFLTFPLDVIPVDAIIDSADVGVFINLLDFASAVPTFLDMVQYPAGQDGLSIDPGANFEQLPLVFGPAFNFLVSDVVNHVRVHIDVTSMMLEAQVPPVLSNLQVRFSRNMSVPPLSPSRPSGRVVRTVVPPASAGEGIGPPRKPATSKPLSPADLAVRRR